MTWLTDKCREYIDRRVNWFKYFGWRTIILALLLLLVFAYINTVYGVDVDLLIGAWFLVMIVYASTSFYIYSREEQEIDSRVNDLCSSLVKYMEWLYLRELIYDRKEEIYEIYDKIKELEKYMETIEEMLEKNKITKEEAKEIMRKIKRKKEKYRKQLVGVVSESLAEYIVEKYMNNA